MFRSTATRRNSNRQLNALDEYNRRTQYLIVPEASGMSGAFYDSDDDVSESTVGDENNTTPVIASQITSKDIRSRIKPFLSRRNHVYIKFMKNWI